MSLMYRIANRVGFSLLVFAGAGVVVALALSFVPDRSIDLSTPERFRTYLYTLFSFDYGASEQYNVPLSVLLWDRGLNSLMLIGGAVLMLGAVGVSLGVGSAFRPGSYGLKIGIGIAHAFSAVPVLVWAFLLLILSGAGFGVYPNFNVLESAAEWEKIFFYGVPILSLGLGDGMLSDIIRNVRNEAQRELEKPHVRALRARNVPVLVHVWQGIVSQVFSAITNKISYLVSGTIVVEVIFDIRGLAWLIYRSVAKAPKEYSLVLAATMLFVGIVVVLNVLGEIVSVMTDPRLRTQTE